jgi:hypothetical protein
VSLLVFRARRPELRSLAVYASVLSGKPSVFGFWTVLHGVAAASEQLKAKFRLRHVVAFRLGAGAPTNSVTTRMRRHSISPARAISARTSKASSGASAGCNEFVAAQDTPIIKKNTASVGKRTDASNFSQPYPGQAGSEERLSTSAPDHVGSWGWFSTSVSAACASENPGRNADSC